MTLKTHGHWRISPLLQHRAQKEFPFHHKSRSTPNEQIKEDECLHFWNGEHKWQDLKLDVQMKGWATEKQSQVLKVKEMREILTHPLTRQVKRSFNYIVSYI